MVSTNSTQVLSIPVYFYILCNAQQTGATAIQNCLHSISSNYSICNYMKLIRKMVHRHCDSPLAMLHLLLSVFFLAF